MIILLSNNVNIVHIFRANFIQLIILRNPPNLQMYKITHNEISGTNFDLKKKTTKNKD